MHAPNPQDMYTTSFLKRLLRDYSGHHYYAIMQVGLRMYMYTWQCLHKMAAMAANANLYCVYVMILSMQLIVKIMLVRVGFKLYTALLLYSL